MDESGAPLEGARVIFKPDAVTLTSIGVYEHDRDVALAALPHVVTGADGRFAIEGAQRGWDRRPSTSPRDASPRLLVRHGEHAVFEYVGYGLVDGEHDVGDIALEAGGMVTGRLLDPDGDPVAGAQVWAIQEEFAPRATPDDAAFVSEQSMGFLASDVSAEDGRFTLGPFWPGTAAFLVEVSGRSLASMEGLAIEAGATLDLGDLPLPLGSGLRGRVQDATGQPVPGADVLARSSEDMGDVTEFDDLRDPAAMALLSLAEGPDARTNDEGVFEIEGVPPIYHTLCVRAPGFEPQLLARQMPDGRELVISLAPEAVLALELAGPAGDVTGTAEVSAKRRSGLSFYGMRFDAPLDVRQESTADGPRTIVAPLGAWRTDVVVRAPGCATAVVVVDGAAPGEVVSRRVELQPERRLSGRVTDENGSPLPGAQLEAAPTDVEDEDLLHVGTGVDDDGSFVIGGLSAGLWRLDVSARGCLRWSQTMDLSQGGQEDVIVSLVRGAVVHGTYFAQDGRPRPGATVEARLAGGERTMNGFPPSARVETDQDGRFEVVGLAPGTWTFGVEPPVSVEVSAGDVVQQDLRDGAGLVLSGRVLTADGPRANCLVDVLWVMPGANGNAFPLASQQTDEQGRFACVVDLPRPSLELVLVAYGTRPPAGRALSERRTVAQGQTLAWNVVFDGEPLTGSVVEETSGAPLAGVAVLLQEISDAGPLVSPRPDRDGFAAWPRTDAEGRFDFPFVRPGVYRLQLVKAGCPDRIVDAIEVGASDREPLRLEMGLGGDVHGEVQRTDGVPIEDGLAIYWRADAASAPGRLSFVVSGRYELTGVPAGPGWVVAVQGFWQQSEQAFSGPIVAEQPVDVPAGGGVALDLVVVP